jgi:hypothetical protein
MLQWGPVAGESRVEYKALSDGVTFLTVPFEEETEIGVDQLVLKLDVGRAHAISVDQENRVLESRRGGQG